MGALAPPPPVPETYRRPVGKKSREKPAFGFVPGGRGAQNAAEAALSLAPTARRAACARAASLDAEAPPVVELAGAAAGPGPVQGRARFSRVAGPLLHHSARRGGRRRRQGQQRGRRLPGSSAPSRGGGERCCCGWRRPPPLSPYRTRGPD